MTRVIEEWMTAAAASPWALALLFVLVLGDAFLVVVPGEAAVTAFGAIAVSVGTPPLAAVIAVAALAAFCGDTACYLVGRTVGLDRWRWMRGARVQAAFAWARGRLDRSTGAIVFTARFIPFARLAVNLAAGAGRVHPPRYLTIAAVAATAWAAYQAVIGAVVALLVPGGPVVAVLVSIGLALALGFALDAVLARRARHADDGGPRHDGRMDEGSRPEERAAATDARWTGYDPDFLGIPVPLPRPADDRATRELRYPRFTVLLDPDRRFAVSTAVDIDGSTLQDPPRRGDWRLDDRVSADEQAGPEVYSSNDLDRGHLVRRRDPGWGTDAQAREATAATFFYPNAAPQAAGFDQSKELWVGLEDHVLAYADATDQRVTVFTAPVLEPDDPPYRGIRIPRRFWKIAAWNSSDAGDEPVLAATGFVLDQTDLIDAASVVPLLGFRTFQVPIVDIAELAGIDLGPLVAADVLLPVPSARAARWNELSSAEKIRL